MTNKDVVMEIYKKLKNNLQESDLVINNEKGVSNLLILSLAEAYGEGFENGKTNGVKIAIESLKETYNTIKN